MTTIDTPAKMRESRPQPATGLALPRRIAALDGVRGLAALLVLVYHFAPEEPPDTLTAVLFAPARLGWTGVDLFFVLSGFLITGILVDAKGDPHYFRNFYARRSLRIFPLYYATLAFVFLVVPVTIQVLGLGPRLEAKLGDQLGHYHYLQSRQYAFWLYLANWPGVVEPGRWFYFMSHFWSLAVEEHFYLIWPFVVWMLSRRRLAYVCVGVILASLLTRSVAAFTNASFFCYIFTPFRLDGLAFGGLLALLARGQGGLESLRGLARRAGGFGVASLAVGAAASRSTAYYTPFASTVGLTLLGLVASCLLILAHTATPESLTGRLFRGPLLGFFGKYSYAIYVFNRFLELPVEKLLPDARLVPLLGSPAVAAAARLGVGIAVTSTLAVMSWHLFEKHFLRLKDAFAHRPAAGFG